jgi:PAS domain S-box-containing protein
VVITFIDITDQKALEVQSRLATVVRDSNDAVTVVDFEGRILAWNRGAEQIYGIAEGKAVGLSVFAIFADRHHDEIKRLVARIAKGETVDRYQTERELRSGRKLRLHVTATALRDDEGRPQAVAATERAISELEQSQYDAWLVLKAMPMPVVVEGMDGRLVYLNAAAETFFRGGSGQPMIGLPAASLVPREDMPETTELLNRCRQGETIRRVRGRRIGGDGHIRTVVLTLLHLDEQGSIATVVDDFAVLPADLS